MTTDPHTSRPAAALWDLDGTIIDSEPLWIETECEMLDRFGLSFPTGSETQLVGFGLTSAAQYFRDLGVPLTVEEIIAEWAEGVVAKLQANTPAWRPGALELLAEFRALGIPNALVTMSFRGIADAVINMLPADTFDVTIAGDEVEHEKPHPDPYLRGAAALGVAASSCVAFEDSAPGSASAAAAGAYVIGVTNTVPLDASEAHVVLPTLEGVTVETVSELSRSHRAAAEEKR